MTTADWFFTDHYAQTPTEFKCAADSNFLNMKRFADNFYGHETNPTSMSIRVDAGYLWNGSVLTEFEARTTSVITKPTTNPRIDRVVMNNKTGALLVVAGTQAASPVPPEIPTGYQPICRVALTTSMTSIVNTMITDERVLISNAAAAVLNVETSYSLDAGNVGQIIMIHNGPCVLTLPPLAAAVEGDSIEIISNTAASQKIQPAFGDTLDTTTNFFRLPSYDRMVVRKIAGTWLITERPAFYVGQVIEMGQADPAQVRQLMGRGWLRADGSRVSRVGYGNLWDSYKLNNTSAWGNGDGSTTFNLPNDSGRMTICAGPASGLTNYGLGQYGGEELHTIIRAELPDYLVPMSDPGHGHSTGNAYFYQSGYPNLLNQIHFVASPYSWFYWGINAGFLSLNPANISIHSGGAGQPHNNMQPYAVVHKYVRV